jgi:hypothetical protein
VEALSQTSNGIWELDISGFELSSRSQVKQLAAGLKNRIASLFTLKLKDIVLGGEDKTGFLDPIFLALAPAPGGEPKVTRLSNFHLRCRKAASNRPSIVSPEALGTFFACLWQYECDVYLQNLGLNNNHCKAMAQQITKYEDSRPFDMLNLCGNPSIGQEGYQALLGLLNRKFNIFCIDVDDQSWRAKFDLAMNMNCKFNRHLYLKEGVFPSKAAQVDFLANVINTPYYSQPNQWLNAIWYTLREDPSLIYT